MAIMALKHCVASDAMILLHTKANRRQVSILCLFCMYQQCNSVSRMKGAC